MQTMLMILKFLYELPARILRFCLMSPCDCEGYDPELGHAEDCDKS